MNKLLISLALALSFSAQADSSATYPGSVCLVSPSSLPSPKVNFNNSSQLELIWRVKYRGINHEIYTTTGPVSGFQNRSEAFATHFEMAWREARKGC